MSEKERLGNSSLKRIFTGIVLAFVVLVATLSDGWLFFSIFWLVILVSAFEWTAFIGLTDYFSKVTYSLATLGLSLICSYATKMPGFSIGYILSGVILWFFLAVIIYRVSRGTSEFPSRNCLSFAFLGFLRLYSDF